MVLDVRWNEFLSTQLASKHLFLLVHQGSEECQDESYGGHGGQVLQE